MPRLEHLRVVERGRHGLIAVAVYSWSDNLQNVQVIVPWTGITSHKDAEAVAEILFNHQARRVIRNTSLAVAVQAGTQILQTCPWFADRQLLNIAGDGRTNVGPGPSPARDAALDTGIVINGLVVGGDPQTIEHYSTEVVGPPHIGFFVTVADYREFARAMLNKFMLEISWLAR